MLDYIAEIIGSFFFFMVILQSTNHPFHSAIGLLAAVYFTQRISGGHLNPAVSFMNYMLGNINLEKFIAYSLSQLIGGAIAVLFYNESLRMGYKVGPM